MEEQKRKSYLGFEKDMRVKHLLLGKGTIVEISNTNKEAVLIHFDDYQGKSQWILDCTVYPITEE
jgi:hypothetical protein